MAYFLPSYFQKRLLRYALSRLDFVDSDALDLDNLGVTIGQRSVVELKNVGVRVEKLIERFDVPAAIVPRHASIRNLRVTIPADLHASGIEIEIDGIKLEVEYDDSRSEGTSKATQDQGSGAPSHTDIANRPRLASSSLHDPGGKRLRRPLDSGDASQIIPAPEDLAASFLQAEPEREKRELQAAVESRSSYLSQQSTHLDASLSEDTDGLAERFSLPGFVTNFFTGIADRLSVTIKNISVALSLAIPGDRIGSDKVTLMLRVEEVELLSLSTLRQSITNEDLRRHVRFAGIELDLVGDSDLLAQRSAVSSPKLSRSRSVVNSDSQHGMSAFGGPPVTTTNNNSLQSSNISLGTRGSGTDTATMEPNMHDSMLASSQMFKSSLSSSDDGFSTDSPDLGRLSPIMNRDHTASPRILRSSSSSSSQISDNVFYEEGDLAQSRLFTHDEAESMYMSATSNAQSNVMGMPGGFENASESPEFSAETATPRLRAPSTTTLRASISHAGMEKSVSIDRRREFQPSESPQPTYASSDCAKCIFRINEAEVKLPIKATGIVEPQGPDYQDPPSQSPRSRRQGRTSPDGLSSLHTRATSDQSVYEGIPKHQNVHVNVAESVGVTVGNVEFFVDTTICQILLKVAVRITQTHRPTDDSKPIKTTPRSIQPDWSAQIHVNSTTFNFMERVLESSKIASQCIPTESTFSVRGDDNSLLQLQILRVDARLALRKGRFDQQINVHRFAFYRQAEKILTFFDSGSVQESFVASSVIIEPDDIKIKQIGERITIDTKPMHVLLDLLVIDDVLSRSGGLSSLLDLGASIASTSTTKSDREKPTPERRRSVHFSDAASPARPNQAPSTSLKLNMRIAACVLDLVGSQSSVQIKTSAIKVVQRSARLRTQISKIIVKGPLTRHSSSDEGLDIRFGDLTLEYADVPDEEDLGRLLQLLAPSNDSFAQDDDIMVDTLLRQRRKGGVLRVSVKEIQVGMKGVLWTQKLSLLGAEVSKLSSVTKYLPEDDRPGLLTFILVNKLNTRLEISPSFGPVNIRMLLLEGAHITVPALSALQVSTFSVSRGLDPIIHELIPNMQQSTILGPPMIMCRFIPEEMEPTVKIKLSNTSIEYNVPLLISIQSLIEALQNDLASSQTPLSPQASEVSTGSSENDLARRIKLSLELRGSAVSLKPLNSAACGLFLFNDAVIEHSNRHETTNAHLDIRKGSIMIIDDITKIGGDESSADPKLYFDQNDTVVDLVKAGFVPVGSISAAMAKVTVANDALSKQQYVDVEFNNNLFFLETCADSTQTLIQIFGGLASPAAPSKIEKYRTEVIPIDDMLASFTGHAFVSERGPELGLQVDETETTPTPSTILDPRSSAELQVALNEDDMQHSHASHDMSESQLQESSEIGLPRGLTMSDSIHSGVGGASVHIAPVNVTADHDSTGSGSIMMHSLVDFRNDHFVQDTSVGGTAHRWDSTQNTYEMGGESTAQQSPLKVRVRDVHIIWNLFDGYDWQNTREVISQAVRDIEDKAWARQRRRESARSPGPDEEEESVIGDVLFNSIYISIPTNRDPRDLTNAINMDLGDAASETGSYATSTTVTATTSKRHSLPRAKPKRLRLRRSRQHKMTFELEGLAVDFLAFPPGSGEIESSVDIRVHKLDIFDHVPTSTWKKFATYMHESGEREVGTDQVHLEMLNVKPVAELTASEIVLKVTVLPLRLHVDQDALDFLTRFFEFKDDRVEPSGAPSNPPFLQRVEVNPVKLRLDFKPKRVDYGGLKSGRTTELMNFIILDRADIMLRRIILYGVSGFDRLGIMLNNIWTPDVRNNQLPTVLAGLAPVRSLVGVGSGVKDLVAVPIREYQKDGRIVRSIQKGAIAFAKTTTTELVNLGAKLAIGTQTVLQNAEDVLAPQHKGKQGQSGASSDSDDDEPPHAISHYADQPLGIVQGLRGAYASLERDLLLAKDAIVAVPGEIMAEGSATGAAKVVLKNSPTIILRPAIGVSKAMGTALLGAGNTLDKTNRRRVEDKYKRR